MHDTKREEIKAAILKRIEDSETFTFQSLHSGLGKYAESIAKELLSRLHRNHKVDFNVIDGKSLWFKI